MILHGDRIDMNKIEGKEYHQKDIDNKKRLFENREISDKIFGFIQKVLKIYVTIFAEMFLI